ncbi:uncharacterized protein METZ01_LOCUS368944, partial [marine metagenome]
MLSLITATKIRQNRIVFKCRRITDCFTT